VIEADWSAASYWYEIAALSDEATIRLIGLKPESLQGDHAISAMMEQFGVRTVFDDAGAVLVKLPETKVTDYFSADFSGCPDLAPAVAATCGALGITADLHGLKNFRLKESDRASALQRELYKFGVKSDFCGGSKFKVYGGNPLRPAVRPVNTYGDHRMAMALAPLAIKTGFIGIGNPGVVSKSYPTFFDDLKNAGFSVVTRVEE
jgi:3-phosphoshikimate 1-carboxyvinyltransferase